MKTNKSLLPQQFTSTTVCKNVIENFVATVILLKKSMIILRG